MTVLLAALSAMVFGIETWQAFFDAGISRAYGNLSRTLTNLPWIASPHAGMIGLGFSREAALAVQLASTGAIIAVLVHLCRIGAPMRFVFALALTAALFVTPHNYPYDWVMVLAGLMIVWQRARHSGFLRFERAGIVLGYLAPLLIAFSKGLGTPIAAKLALAPMLALAVILVTALRAHHEAAQASADPRQA